MKIVPRPVWKAAWQPTNQYNGLWTYASEKITRELFWEVVTMICSLDDLSTGVGHDDQEILSQSSRGTPRPEICDAGENMLATSVRFWSSGFVNKVQISCSSSLQLGLGTLTPAVLARTRGVKAPSSATYVRGLCPDTPQTVWMKTSTLTHMSDQCNNHLNL